MKNRYIIITSIFPPNEAIRAYSKFKDYQLVVVGDKKSPTGWKCENVIYLSPEDQDKLGFNVLKLLPWNHYCRKMVGYLYAIKHGAEIIVDTDDDNIPLDNWYEPAFEGKFLRTKPDGGFINIYCHFSNEFVWPRGYPLRYILEHKPTGELEEAQTRIGVWQFLANGDPDVDAIYRLVINKIITFKDEPAFVLNKGTLSPFNSQNTFFTKEAFPLLYLPSFVTFRFTDILRGLVAQPLLWSANLHLGVGPATVRQDRNPHDYLKDFESEVPVFLNTEKTVDVSRQAINQNHDLLTNLVSVYKALAQNKIASSDELELLEAWVKDISNLMNL